jgi:hypothetical protein
VPSIWYSFIPILTISALGLAKIALFRVKDAYFTLSLCLGCIGMCITVESHFDGKHNFNFPLWGCAAPLATMMMVATWRHFKSVFYEPDPAKRLFYCYDSKIKQCTAVLAVVATFGFFISLPIALYCLELAFTNRKEGKQFEKLICLDAQIVRWLLFSGLIYCVFMMEFIGSMFNTLIFGHLLPDMIDEVQLRRDTSEYEEQHHIQQKKWGSKT